MSVVGEHNSTGEEAPERPDLESFTPNTTTVSTVVEVEADGQQEAKVVLDALPSKVRELAFNGWPVYKVDMEADEQPAVVPHFGHSIACYRGHPEYEASRGPGIPDDFPVEDKCGGISFNVSNEYDSAIYRFFSPSVTVAGRPNHDQIAGTYELDVRVENGAEDTSQMRNGRATTCDVQLHLNGMRVRDTINFGERNISPMDKTSSSSS